MQSKGGCDMEQQIDLGLLAGANLKHLIQNSAYKTQEAFSLAFGTSVRNVRRWIKSGIRRLDTLQELALFFGTDVFAFLS